jgi:hypothetical protein
MRQFRPGKNTNENKRGDDRLLFLSLLLEAVIVLVSVIIAYPVRLGAKIRRSFFCSSQVDLVRELLYWEEEDESMSLLFLSFFLVCGE